MARDNTAQLNHRQNEQGGLKVRLDVRPLRPATQRRAERFVSLTRALGGGEYADVKLDIKSGCDMDGSWWYAEVYCRGVRVATVNNRYVTWFDYTVKLHLYIQKVLTEAFETRRQECFVKAEAEANTGRLQRLIHEKELRRMVDNFRT